MRPAKPTIAKGIYTYIILQTQPKNIDLRIIPWCIHINENGDNIYTVFLLT